MQVKQVLSKVDKLLSHPNTWCKGTEDNGRGRHCLVGAVRKVVQENTPDYLDDNIEDVLDIISQQIPDNNDYFGGNVVEFNDAPKTSFKDIKALIRRARKAVK